MTQVYAHPFTSSVYQRGASFQQRPVDDTRTLREFQKSDTYYSHQQPYQRSTWEPLSPMSDHKKASFETPFPKSGETFPKRPEVSQAPAREQLPPLSSLFGASSHPGRPAQSSYSDRQSPVFPAASLHEVRHPATPIHPERPFETSYFSRPGAGRQFYTSRSIHSERLGFPAPPHSASGGNRPESPRYEVQQYAPSEASRTLPSAWSPRSQSSRPEYFARDTSSSFRPHSEHRPHPPQVLSTEHDSRTYRDAHHNPPTTSTYSSSSANAVASDVPATKDGLGPKIWTGTQFLPRFVRQAEVSGEGLCYFYDDGTHCKTVIDGEVVNAHWGVTKAGKPRKRLAIACITCREKKIKCDPDFPRCVQCEKFGRVCKFKNAPRGGQGSPDTPPADGEELIARPVSSRTEAESFRVEQREESRSISPRQPLRRPTPELNTRPSKRQRTGYTDFTPVASEASPRLSVREPTSPSNPWLETLVTSPIDHGLLREWQVNPYAANPALITELMQAFFQSVPETAYCMFPEGPFKAWVLGGGEKSLDDLMLIYTVLALATAFSPKPEHKAFGIQYASISRYACDNRQFSIQLVQSRLLLGVYYFAINNPNDSWDACGGAIRASSGLRLNIEIEKSEDANLKIFPYGLNRAGYAECRRRTFWSCYLMDRFNGFCSGHFSTIQSEDVFLRMPCDTKSFESQMEVHNPYFEPTTLPIQNTSWTLGSMAYLINICAIWGDVMANIYRSTQRQVQPTTNAAFTGFYEKTTQRLQAWKDSLPPCYQLSAESMTRAIEGSKLGTYVTMHAVYHTTLMKLNRHILRSTLNDSQVAHHIFTAQQNAEALLSMMDTLAARRPSMPTPTSANDSMLNKLSSPFVGYAIVSAIDIVTAKVSLANLPTRLSSFSGAQAILGEIALFWQSARTQEAVILQRIRELAELMAGKGETGGAGAIGFKLGTRSEAGRDIGDGMFEMRDAIEKTFSRDYDCVYA